jgi:hypothetical protein
VSTPAETGEVSVDLSAWTRVGVEAKVKRMTAPGLDSKDAGAATWAGQSFMNGTPSGEEVVEGLQEGKVTVRGSEAVLVFF